MPQLGELASVTAGSGRGGLTGAALNKSIAGATIYTRMTLHGERVLAQDFYTLAAIADPLVAQLVLFFGEGLKEVAKQIHSPNIDTQATYDSISAGPDPGGPPFLFGAPGGGWAIEVGPFTEQARFQEWGFTHYLSGEWIQNPFMMPAADVIEPLFFDAMYQIAQIAQSRRFFSGPAQASGAAGILASTRNFLYSYSKFAGDVQVLGFGGLGGSRGASLRGAKALGDLDASMKGALGARTSRRVVGRFASVGITSRVSANLFGPSSSWTGSSSRIYNRIRGKTFGEGLRGL